MVGNRPHERLADRAEDRHEGGEQGDLENGKVEVRPEHRIQRRDGHHIEIDGGVAERDQPHRSHRRFRLVHIPRSGQD